MMNSWISLDASEGQWDTADKIEELIGKNDKPWSKWSSTSKRLMSGWVSRLEEDSIAQLYNKPKDYVVGKDDMRPQELVKNLRAHNKVIRGWRKKFGEKYFAPGTKNFLKRRFGFPDEEGRIR